MLKLILGTTGCGKTLYAKSLGWPTVSFDELWNYGTKKMNYGPISDLAKRHDVFILDSILLNRDPKLTQLRKAIRPHKIDVSFIYTNLDHLYECQRSTPARLKRREQAGLTKQEDDDLNRRVLTGVNDLIKSFLSEGIIESIVYIYRVNDSYSCFDNDNHFQKVMEK